MFNSSRRFKTIKFGVRNEYMTKDIFFFKVLRSLIYESANMKNICQITFISVRVMKKSFNIFFAKLCSLYPLRHSFDEA